MKHIFSNLFKAIPPKPEHVTTGMVLTNEIVFTCPHKGCEGFVLTISRHTGHVVQALGISAAITHTGEINSPLDASINKSELN